jgi:hypothetical protein
MIRPAEARPALFGPAVAAARPRLSASPRTWILAAATAAAVTFVLLQPPRDQGGAGRSSAPTGARDATAIGGASAAAPSAVPAAAAPVDGASRSIGVAAAPTAPADSIAAPAAPAAAATEADAANLLAAGRQREALALYDELARARPDRPAFAAIARILQRRLAARCDHAQPGGSPCPPAP